jgi:hypothetical protein
MMTLRQFSQPPPAVLASTAWYLADLGQALGRQELFTKQSPQRLKVLREHALIESAVSSNRIEGVEVDPARVGTVVFGKALLRDRDEAEVRGYRKALDLGSQCGTGAPGDPGSAERIPADRHRADLSRRGPRLDSGFARGPQTEGRGNLPWPRTGCPMARGTE